MKNDADLLFSRRSIRKYKGRSPISSETVKYIIEAAMCAPSARNMQPWHFVLTQDHHILDVLSERHPYAKMLKEASLAIIVCGDKRVDDNESYLLQNCAVATQNLLLAAHACELGAVWLGVHPREERIKMCREIFSLPDYIMPVALISVGYPDEKKSRNDNYESYKVHWDKWSE